LSQLHYSRSRQQTGIYAYGIITVRLQFFGGLLLETIDIARQAVEAASDKQAIDIALLDTRDVCSFADYFVICSGDSSRQIEAIRDAIEQMMKKQGIQPHHYEGSTDSGWLLMDYGGIVIHIFTPEEREYYQLDKLWGQANTLVRIQ